MPRRLQAALLAAMLSACSPVPPRPFLIEDIQKAEHLSDQEAERRAREALADIQRRVDTGDLPKIQFRFDSDEITADSYETLDLIADVVLSNPHLKVFVLAHTDSVGTDAYNQDLALRRAKSVKAYLVKRGIPPPSIRFHGYGFTRPLADNATDEGRAKNRRVEFRVTTRDWSSVY